MKMKKMKTKLSIMEAESQSNTSLIPGLSDDMALLCFARLSILSRAIARATSHSWRSALSPSVLNPIRKSSNLPSQQFLFLSLSTAGHSDSHSFFMVDIVYWRCYALSKLDCGVGSYILNHNAVSTHGHFYLPTLEQLDNGSCMNLLRFSRASIRGDSGSYDRVDVARELLECGEWSHDVIQVPGFDSSISLWSSLVGLGPRLFVIGGTAKNCALSIAMSYNGDQWTHLAELNEPRFMAAGFVFKSEVWVVGGRRLGHSGLEVVESGEVYKPKEKKWHVVHNMWPKYLQTLEGKPCFVVVKGRIFGFKMGSNMVVVWDEGREEWDFLGLVGEEYVEKGFKGRLVGLEEEKLWAICEEPVTLFELETSLDLALKGARPCEEVIPSKGNMGNLSWRKSGCEFGLDEWKRVLDCTLIDL